MVLHVVRPDLQLYVCLKLKAGLQKEIAQGCYLAKQVELLKTQLVSAGLEPASAEQPDDGHVSSHILHCHWVLSVWCFCSFELFCETAGHAACMIHAASVCLDHFMVEGCLALDTTEP